MISKITPILQKMKFWQLRFSVFKNEDQNNKRQNHSNGIG
jgi:hypothetical protein